MNQPPAWRIKTLRRQRLPEFLLAPILNNIDYVFNFSGLLSAVHIRREVPDIRVIFEDMARKTEGEGDPQPVSHALLVCDENTFPIAAMVQGGQGFPLCVLSPGEERKNWASTEQILRSAREAGLGRDGLFIAVGGGVVSDLTAFAASVYMRGARLCIVSTTLLGMVDAAMGGKTGFDLLGIKNLVGTFFPARHVYLPIESLRTLPQAEWKSGMAELIKTAVLDGDEFLSLAAALNQDFPPDSFSAAFPQAFIQRLLEDDAENLIDGVSRSVAYKGRIVESDPKETGTQRALLNLGHTFAHALESAAGLGRVSHGEAVAWGIVRASELGKALGITPPERGETISRILASYGYKIAAPHPLLGDIESFLKALGGDKKKKGGKQVFIIPAAQGALKISPDNFPLELLSGIVSGDHFKPLL